MSEAQRRLLFAKFGPAWVRKHHFDTKGPLPAHVGRKAVVNQLRSNRSSSKSTA